MTIAFLFWISVGLIVYSYFVYPILLGLVAAWHRVFPRFQVEDGAALAWPKVSLIIAAYKEQDVILQRVHNALMADYPVDRMEVIIGVDGDLDGTGELVASVQDDRIRLQQFPVRRGKASVLNDCVATASGEILLFSDANTFWEADAVKKLVRHFVDDNVGGVCGRLILVDAAGGENCDGLYWRYENQLKEWEGEMGALLGANGAIYALRRPCYRSIPANTIVDDFMIGMRVHEQKLEFRYEPTAIAREETAPTIGHEFQRRSRIGAGAFQSLVWLWKLLLPTYGRISWAFWSHKVLRWICPFLMLTALVTNCFLLSSPLYQWLLAGQCLIYLAAILGAMSWLPGRAGKLAQVVWMFVNMNLALANGFRKWLFQTQTGTWKRTERAESEKTTERELVAR